jgi:hypothetical protein
VTNASRRASIRDAYAVVNRSLFVSPSKVLTGAEMKTHTQPHRDYSFVIGLAAGTFVGAALAIWLAPRVGAELRERITASARTFGQRASEHHEQASARVGDAVDALTRPRAVAL